MISRPEDKSTSSYIQLIFSLIRKGWEHMSDDIWFGINEAGESRDFETMRKMCLAAEECGFDFFSIPDHFMDPGTGRGPPLECWSMLAGLAAVTKRIKLAPLVSCYGYREPTVLGRMATTVDIISNGRLILGLGAGWHEKEFKGYFGRFPSVAERMKGLEEAVEICKGMFTNEESHYNGSLYKYSDVLNSPRPVQKQIPIMVGGGGEKVTLKIAAKHADISHFHPWCSLEVVKRKLEALKDHCKTVGRDYSEIRKGIGFILFLGRDNEEVQSKIRKTAEASGGSSSSSMSPEMEMFRIGTPNLVAEQLQNYIEIGFGFFSLTFAPSTTPEDMQLFSEEVLPQLS
jgi:alkanesulfonate monooxygenase SsuD/methylene tetrahydromethanopterin reductase-like flavin-dependent oxidoreductase (luciferase family)